MSDASGLVENMRLIAMLYNDEAPIAVVLNAGADEIERLRALEAQSKDKEEGE